ncbi:Fc.00g059720.m01.CDS01 [Cosmosporella sp. VM-42]
MRTFHPILVAALSSVALAQAPPAVLQSTGFNSSFTLTQSQIESANLSDTLVANLENIINFDRSQLANGGPQYDSFYKLPPLSGKGGIKPGVLLKVQSFTSVCPFAIPPNTALSRILYTTTNLNGTVIPASSFILWPFTPRRFEHDSMRKGNTAPAVLWTHGTSGFFASAAPSTHRALWYGDAAPFALALDGYAVVAPDYAGLGISKSWDGSAIPHEYLASPTSAHDALYAMRASLKAFPGLLSKEFVVMGHSQGGGVAWGVAELLAAEASKFADLVKGYRGTVAASPTTDVFSGVPQFILPWVGMMLNHLFPTFRLEEWLTPLGIARTSLLRQVEGGISVGQQLYLNGDAIIKEDYTKTWYVDAYGNLANAGGKAFQGPLLVIQGTQDGYVPYKVTAKTVQTTCDLKLKDDLEFLVVNGTGHVPTLDATRKIWIDWIADRFEQKPVSKKGCIRTDLESFLPAEQYLSAGNAFPQWAGAAEYSYQTPLGP